MEPAKCRLKNQGLPPGSCLVLADGKRLPACRATLKTKAGDVQRLIASVHLSRPENDLSIYQSGCNFSCRKCRSWYFSKVRDGAWYTADDILSKCLEYDSLISHKEPREKATAWHAQETCRCCGSCVMRGARSGSCPGLLDSVGARPRAGPALNIIMNTAVET